MHCVLQISNNDFACLLKKTGFPTLHFGLVFTGHFNNSILGMHYFDGDAYEWRSEPNIIISACLFLSIPPTPQAVWNGQQVPLLPQSCSAGSFSLWKARPGECISGSDTSIVLGIALSRVLFTSKYPGSVAFSPRLLLVCVESIPLPLLLQLPSPAV